MNNFYELFGISNTASTKDIISAYENKINKFSNLKILNQTHIDEIKMFKVGLHILTNTKLKEKYNKIININNINKSTEPLANNEIYDNTLDSVFNVDNSWMKNYNNKIDNNDKKIKYDTNIGDRVFSLSDMNKRPGFSSESEVFLRMPSQGRENKTNKLN
jgi:hypothetical protein